MARDPWNTAHGRAAECGRLVASECCPSDELADATPADAVRPQRGPDGRFLPGNGLGAGRRHRPAGHSPLAALAKQGDDAARAALAHGRRYATHRRQELSQAHGGAISAGVGAVVESAGEALAGARYWSARSMAEASADFARLAATLMAQHRQCERDAWELAAREAAARPKQDPVALLQRRLQGQDGAQ
jgi:hypothetical protein